LKTNEWSKNDIFQKLEDKIDYTMTKFIFRRLFYLISIITFFYSINYLRLQAKVKTKISKNDALVNKTEKKVAQVNYKNSLKLIFWKGTTRSELTKLIKFMFQMNAFVIEIPVLEKEYSHDYSWIFTWIDVNWREFTLIWWCFTSANFDRQTLLN
jgi:hypothetical protein